MDVIRAVPRDGFFVEEICQVGFTARFGFAVYAPRTYVTCDYQENLEFGVSTARPWRQDGKPGKGRDLYHRRRRLHVRRTGACNGLQYRINRITVVFNNRGFGGRLVGEALQNRTSSSSRKVSTPSRTALNQAELKIKLKYALAQISPKLIEVSSAPGAEASPWPRRGLAVAVHSPRRPLGLHGSKR